MITETLEALVGRAVQALGSGGAIVGGENPDMVRFALFGASNSVCSQKVRCVLAHHRTPYVNHAVNLFAGQTYLPDYVRLRMEGCARYGGPLASRHSGSTSSKAGGCDGAVVPTLIDWQARDVVIDSRKICAYLDDRMPAASRLRPAWLADAIDEQLDIVDNLPNYQLLMGRKPDEGEPEATAKQTGGAFSLTKVAWCDDLLDRYRDDDVLVRAYTAKRAKELSASQNLFSRDAMKAAEACVGAALGNLEQSLALHEGAWLYGEAESMADLFWGVELLRIENLGMAGYWGGGRLPLVAAYLDAARRLPSIRASIIEWPGAMF